MCVPQFSRKLHFVINVRAQALVMGVWAFFLCLNQKDTRAMVPDLLSSN